MSEDQKQWSVTFLKYSISYFFWSLISSTLEAEIPSITKRTVIKSMCHTLVLISEFLRSQIRPGIYALLLKTQTNLDKFPSTYPNGSSFYAILSNFTYFFGKMNKKYQWNNINFHFMVQGFTHRISYVIHQFYWNVAEKEHSGAHTAFNPKHTLWVIRQFLQEPGIVTLTVVSASKSNVSRPAWVTQ